ncbi:uncharacterized protein LOC110430906 [Sorghum bicolor]|uniref:uncharacterized protein LOC110430906 n=1 Tax=Sorghum bicolor TaxID=4558 RepID=UPI000B424B7E|nr:uncharacterized protein LOC110430906 [Sorghum bicolor]|eukprot:XP_021304786.1 uncharacterized protein LOC110430906 [Sorghum bicolor]
MHFISAIPKLTGQNYVLWREELDAALALAEIDFALQEPKPTEPEEPERAQNETDEAFANRKRDFAPIRAKYDLEKYKWEKSNRKCKIVIKKTITEGLRGAIPECETAKEYLEKVKNQFTGSTKAHASTLIQKLTNMRFTGGSVREHILSMSTMAAKLEKLKMPLADGFLIHLALNSLPKEYETFVVNYNTQPEEWDLEKVIAMCVQEEERLKNANGGSVNFVKGKNKKPFYNKKAPDASTSQNKGGSTSQPKAHPKQDNQHRQEDPDRCRWCNETGHWKHDCPKFMKHCLVKGIQWRENPSKRRKTD